MPEFLFIAEEAFAHIVRVEAADAQTALSDANLGDLPRKIVGAQSLGTYWILDDDDNQVVRKAVAPRASAAESSDDKE